MLPLGGLISHMHSPSAAPKACKGPCPPIDAFSSQQLVGEVMAYQGNDVKVKDESLNTRSGE